VTLLARVGEQLYRSARRLERAEGVARVVLEHTNVLVDMPVSVPLTWEPLIDMAGDRDAYAAAHPAADEASIVRWLVTDHENPDSLAASVEGARESLRTCREVIPTEAWVVANDLHLYVAAHRDSAHDRRDRVRLIERVVADHQRFLGILLGNMTRDEAFTLMRLGRHVERAGLTTRVLDVRAGSLLAPDAATRYDDVQWISVLRSLSALHMYHRTAGEPVAAAAAMRFLLLEARFPRSAAYCLDSMGDLVQELPRPDAVAEAIDAAAEVLDGLGRESGPGDLHRAARALAMALVAIQDRIAETWFPVASWGG